MASIATDTYDVVMTVDDSDSARAVARQTAAVRMIDAQWRSMANSHAQAMRAAADSTQEAIEPTDTLAESMAGMASKAVIMGAAFKGLSMASDVMHDFHDILMKMREYATGTAEKTQDFRDALRDIQAMQGGGGVTRQTEEGVLRIMEGAGMKETKAHDFMVDILGTAKLYEGRMAPGEFDKLQVAAARFAMVKGGDPATYAALAGKMMGTGAAQGQTAEGLVGRMGRFFEIAKMTTGGTPEANISQMMGVMETLVLPGGAGMVGSPEALGALGIGASSMKTGRVGATLEQFARAVTGQGRAKEWTAFLRDQLQIKEGTHAEEAMIPIFSALEEAQRSGVKPADFLKAKGLTDLRGRSAILAMYSRRKEVEQYLRPQAGTDRQTAEEINRAFADEQGPLAMDVARQRTEAATIRRGREEGGALLWRQRAHTSLIDKHMSEAEANSKQTMDEYFGRKFTEYMSWSGSADTQKAREEREAVRLWESSTGHRFQAPVAGTEDTEDLGSWLKYSQSDRFQKDLERSERLRASPATRLRRGLAGRMTTADESYGEVMGTVTNRGSVEAMQNLFRTHGQNESVNILRQLGYTVQQIDALARVYAAKPMAIAQVRGRVKPT